MTRFVLGIALASVAAFAAAQPNSVTFINNIPTLDEYGLVALMALVATVGGWLARRRK